MYELVIMIIIGVNTLNPKVEYDVTKGLNKDECIELAHAVHASFTGEVILLTCQASVDVPI